MTWESKSDCSKVIRTLGDSQGLADFPFCISEQRVVPDPQASSGDGEAYPWLHSLVTELFGFTDDNLW